MNDRQALIALSSFAAFGPVRLKLLLEYYGSPRKVWTAAEGDLQKTGLSPNLLGNFADYRRKFDDRAYFSRMKKLKISVTTIYDSEYPSKLLTLQDKPILLYSKGNRNLLEKPSIAVVGSRKMSFYGKKSTEMFTKAFVKEGYVVISGLARGVDTTAHVSVVDSGGETVAILGSGVDVIYPPENSQLYVDIIKKGGLIISEYPLGYPPLPSNFVLRNRLISALSDAVLVVEGKRKSGTLITASNAANQGKQVFAVPGQIDSPLSEASHFLIQNGAKLVTAPEDVLEEITEISLSDARVIKNELENKLLQIITEKPLHIDDIVKISSLETLDVSARLTNMEIRGLVKKLNKGYYQKVES